MDLTSIPGFEDRYTISKDGRVFGKRGEMKQEITHNGYKRVQLYVSKTQGIHCLVHRLMALTFLPNPENKPEVNHINNNKEDNRLENLEWVFHTENQQRMKHYKTQTGEHHIQFKNLCYNRDTKNHKKGEVYGQGFQGGYYKDGKHYRFEARTLEDAIQKRDELYEKLYGQN